VTRLPAPSDDPGGGRALTRRLRRVLPIALAVGLAAGVPLAVLASDWRPAVALPLALAAIAGTILAAIEDGRVQRRVDASAGGPSTATGLRAAHDAAHAGDAQGASAGVERALLRGATTTRVVAALDHPEWTAERVAAMARALGAGDPSSNGGARAPGGDESG
jgi:hypothetical protein